MDLRELLARLEASGFSDFSGAHLSATVPVSDRLLSEIAGSYMPQPSAVRDLELLALAGDRFRIRARLAAATFLPPVGTTVSIVQQPQFPARPTLVLQLGAGGAMLSRIGGVMGFLRSVPPGVRVEGETIVVDVAELLARRGYLRLLPLIERLNITTEPGRVVVVLAARVPSPPA